jgi:hypothetical protein
VELLLPLHGLWEGVVSLPRPPPPPYDIETMESIGAPSRAIKEWIADAPALAMRIQDPPPDLLFIIRSLNATVAFLMKHLIWTGSAV